MKLFHVSTVPNLKILEPHISTHGKAYVYATINLEFALFFGSKKSMGDLDGKYGIKDNIPFFYEAYEGAFKRRFENATCYVYEVDPSTFKEGKTSFKGEVVSELPVKVLSCIKIDNLYKYLLKLNAEDKIDLQFFNNTKEYTEMIDNHITDRIKGFGILKNKDSRIYNFCEEHFPTILSKLNKDNDEYFKTN